MSRCFVTYVPGPSALFPSSISKINPKENGVCILKKKIAFYRIYAKMGCPIQADGGIIIS